jgi:triphosphatase
LKSDAPTALPRNGAGRGKPVHAEQPLELEPELSGEAVLQRAGRACLDHSLRNEGAALSGDAEGIHQMRVAERRLRAILSALAPLLPKERRRWASNRLRCLADILGEARNIDVFAAALLQPARAALPDTREFERLTQTTENRRKATHRRGHRGH